MMNFSLKPAPAKENLEMSPGAVDGGASKDPISAGAHLHVYSNAIMGVVGSLSNALVARGLTKEDINGKISEFINLVAANGDIDTQCKGWIFDHDFSNKTWDIKGELDKFDQDRKYDSWWTILDEAQYGLRDAKWNEAFKAKMNDREKALLEAYQEAEHNFHKAKGEYDEYIRDHAIITINDIFVKYAEVLSKIDRTWYDDVEIRIRTTMAEVNRRRAEKKAEEEATSDRATEAK